MVGMPALQQTMGIILPNGQRLPPSVRAIGNTIVPVNPARVTPNLFIMVQRIPINGSDSTPKPSADDSATTPEPK